MTFNETYNLLIEQIGVNYKAPNDPKLAMADFYLLSYLYTMDPNDKMVAHNTKNINNRDYEGQVSYMANELVDFLKPSILRDVSFAIAAESRHLTNMVDEITYHNKRDRSASFPSNFDSTDIEFIYEIVDGNDRGEKQVINTAVRGREKTDDDFDDFHPEFDTYRDEDGNEVRGMDSKNKHHAESAMERSIAWTVFNKAMKKVSIKLPQAISIMKKAFEDLEWEPSFAGKPWADICDGWHQLYFSNTIEKDFVAIDHIFDLQHNNGSVFDKLVRYKQKGRIGYNHYWLNEFLDFKRGIKSPAELIPLVSPAVAKTAIAMLRNTGGHDKYLEDSMVKRNKEQASSMKDEDDGASDFEALIRKISLSL